MHIITLMENTDGGNGCAIEHGLSFYVETAKHKILLDTGASDRFIANAEKLGVDLTAVDTVILSHGHYDHTGGVMPFVRINDQAKIYLRDCANGAFYHVEENDVRYIGIEPAIMELRQLVPVHKRMAIDEEIDLFTNITGRRFYSRSNKVLKMRLGDSFVDDPFHHEMCTVIHQDGKNYLFSGCAHNGVLNILDRYHVLYGGWPDVVLTGFHFMKKTEYTEEEKQNILGAAAELAKLPILFYSGHCTGEAAFALMKDVMGDQLIQLHSGSQVM